MDQIPPAPPQGTSLFEMEIDAIGQNHLNTISKWGKFIAITLLILLGLGVLGLATQYETIIDRIGELLAFNNSAAGILLTILLVVIGMAILMLVYLLRACIFIRQGLVSQNADRIADGFRALKVVFTIGIIFSSLTLLAAITSFFN